MEEDLSELIQYLSERFDKVDKKLEDMRQDFVSLQTGVDAYAKKADTYFQEMVMLSHKIDRHEKWIQQIAGKLGVELTY